MYFYKKEVCPICSKEAFSLIKCSKCEIRICAQCCVSDWKNFPEVICDKCLTASPKEDIIQ